MPTTSTVNDAALAFIARHSAHSDVVSELTAGLSGLGGASVRGDMAAYKAAYAVADEVVFACAIGMSEVHVRLPADLLARARATGWSMSDIGPEWVSWVLFRTDWPQVDLRFWLRKAYAHARATAGGH